MEWLEVLQRIQAGEDDRTEFGRFRNHNEKDWRKSACAFANSEGGLIILGVNDDGSIDGVPMDSEAVQERLTSQLSSFSPPIRARLGRHRDPAGWVHWIDVSRMRGPEPVRHGQLVYVRRGRSSVEPTPSELQELYNTFGLVFTEERTIPGTGIDDIETTSFVAYMARKGILLDDDSTLPLETDLLNREVLGRDADGALRATLFGLLCFGKRPQVHSHTRNFAISLVAYDGIDRGDAVRSSAEANGRLDEQVLTAEAWVKGLGRTERYEGSKRTDEYIVPLVALRECTVNAVAHRDYTILGSRVLVEVFDDRLVVTSPGALPNHKRPESVLAGGTPRSRNEAMASVLLDLGLMEQRGSGFPRIRKAMREFNGTDPELENERDERWVRVTLRRASSSA